MTNTVYVTNAGSNSVTVLNGRTCNGQVHRGCEAVASGTGPPTGATTTKPSTVPTA